jgi:hypothetical protein
MLLDLTFIRADRDRYYYGLNDLMTRHQDIINNLAENAQILLPVLLEGMVWRSRFAIAGQRRVNTYIQHLIVNLEGNFARALEWIVRLGDPQIVCHHTFVLVSEIMWTGVAYSTFIKRKLWLMLQLAAFILSNALFPFVLIDVIDTDKAEEKDVVNRWLIFLGRLFVYVFSMLVPLFNHLMKIGRAYRGKETYAMKLVKVPRYLIESWMSLSSLILAVILLVMLVLEPVIWCRDAGTLFQNRCADADGYDNAYFFLAMVSTFLYFSQLSDVLVTSTKVSAYYLVCTRMFVEMGLFLIAYGGILLMFSSALSCLEHKSEHFTNVPVGALILFQMTLAMFDLDEYMLLVEEGVVFAMICVFMFIAVIFLINALIAQFNCAYDAIYADMVGYARLKRIKIIVETLPLVTKEKWQRFLASMDFEKRLEFNDGDVGLSGGVQTHEPSNAHPTTDDRILRFGGSTDRSIPFPDTSDDDEDNDRFGRMEKVIARTLEKLSTSDHSGPAKGGSKGNESGSHHSGNEMSAGSQGGE